MRDKGLGVCLAEARFPATIAEVSESRVRAEESGICCWNVERVGDGLDGNLAEGGLRGLGVVGLETALGVAGRLRGLGLGLGAGLTAARSACDRGRSCNERMEGDLGDCMDEAETNVSSEDADLAVVGRGAELVVDSCPALVPLSTSGVTRGFDGLAFEAGLGTDLN